MGQEKERPVHLSGKKERTAPRESTRAKQARNVKATVKRLESFSREQDADWR
jgi:hypothetical protein